MPFFQYTLDQDTIESNKMVGFIQSKGFLETLEYFANKLNEDYDWDFIPKRYLAIENRAVGNRWGRTAIEFATPDWKPTITVGFMHDEWDHGVQFVDRQKGIDLLLRIETSPSEQKNIHFAFPELERKREALMCFSESALLLGEKGNHSNHSLLIVRCCLANVIEQTGDQMGQLEKIHGTLRNWGRILFSDGSLEEAFKLAGLDSGISSIPNPTRSRSHSASVRGNKRRVPLFRA